MNATGELKLSANALRLSEPLTATVILEGDAPMSVTPPLPLLRGASLQAWQIVPAGPPTVTPMLDGQERWTQAYRLEPFVAGTMVPVDFAPYVVNGTPIVIPAQTVEVRSTLGEGEPVPRDFAGAEALPAVTPPQASSLGPVIAVGLAAIILGAAIWHRLRRTRAAVIPHLTPHERVAMIERETDPRRFIEQLSALLREGQATKTTAEIAVCDPDRAAMLARCDAVIFAGEPLSETERTALTGEASGLFFSRNAAQEDSPGQRPGSAS